ncbi:alpha/beta hydrolase [Ramlibacter sp. G-1-2-2]|uniref:Alpha/beta hydrolase n=1 Tax=Ramlibacter agri TaxID=2728837 RepID=A0A848H9J3_9BURK|nr:alpha/beta hydrolase [Ramlibacter agri]NML47435.1 alpha/beta hydrolase [Ramlibacter agri]
MTTETCDTIEVRDVEYLRHGDAPLLARLYLPKGAGPFPLVAEIHGGAWCRGDRLDEDRLNRALAKAGIAVAALDFRMPPTAGYPASLQDVHAALRWLRTQAPQLRTRQEWIGVMGLSSGAHQAILAAMRPRDPRYAGTPDSDTIAVYAVLCWPVIDPLGRYRYAKDLQASGQPYPEIIDRVIPDHDKYWLDEAAMAEGSPVLALERGEQAVLPPVLYIQGEEDMAHPRAHLERFVAAWRKAGGSLRLKLFPGEAESFINKKPDSPATAAAIDAIVTFVQEQCHAG